MFLETVGQFFGR